MEDLDLKISYDADGTNYDVFVTNARHQLSGGRETPPVPVMARHGEGYVKVGYCSRSPSGRALIISTSTSRGFLSIEWTPLISLVRGERKQVPVARLNAPLI